MSAAASLSESTPGEFQQRRLEMGTLLCPTRSPETSSRRVASRGSSVTWQSRDVDAENDKRGVREASQGRASRQTRCSRFTRS